MVFCHKIRRVFFFWFSHRGSSSNDAETHFTSSSTLSVCQFIVQLCRFTGDRLATEPNVLSSSRLDIFSGSDIGHFISCSHDGGVMQGEYVSVHARRRAKRVHSCSNWNGRRFGNSADLVEAGAFGSRWCISSSIRVASTDRHTIAKVLVYYSISTAAVSSITSTESESESNRALEKTTMKVEWSGVEWSIVDNKIHH